MSRKSMSHEKGGPALWLVALLKRTLLLFWAGWLSLVFTTNLLDGAKAMGLLGSSWAFASGNYDFLVQTTSRYGTPGWLNALLFLGVVTWEGWPLPFSGWPGGPSVGRE
jgi:hypothetical protein